ncbi:unnamed protein product [Lupinus luteus]|uniref:Uncharacterized protein n=1 Tax=Lupinus luteus TaxID=3873 RepID=A0AAV1Y4T8_LUPLU
MRIKKYARQQAFNIMMGQMNSQTIAKLALERKKIVDKATAKDVKRCFEVVGCV